MSGTDGTQIPGATPGKRAADRRTAATITTHCDRAGLAAAVLASGLPSVDGGRRGAAAVRAGAAAVVFCCNIFGSDFTTPPLSTIRSPLFELGVAALRRVLAALEGTGEQLPAPALATELVLRGSTGRAPGP